MAYFKLVAPIYMVILMVVLKKISLLNASLVVGGFHDVLFWVGLGIMGAGVLLDVVSIAQFFMKGTTVAPHGESAVLVTGGLYRFSRNPMYLGQCFILVGWGVRYGYLLTPIAGVLFVVIVNALFIKSEEGALGDKFGARFSQYCQDVRRWI